MDIHRYFHDTRDQFRLRGTLSFHGNEVEAGGASENTHLALARYKSWNAMGTATAAGHLGPKPGAEKNSSRDESSTSEALSEHPPVTLLLGVVSVAYVDHLHLGKRPYRRVFTYATDSSEWQETEVNP